MATTTQTRKIQISVDTKGAPDLKALQDIFAGLNRNTKDLADGFNLLKGATGSFLGGFSIKTLADFADQITVIQNRLVALTGSQEEANKVFQGLVDISRETNTSLETISETYTKLGQATNAAHLSQKTLLELTETLINSFRLSGVGAEQAAAGTQTLARAFAQGTIQARELRTILSQNGVILDLLRQKFGRDLLKDAKDGLLTLPQLMKLIFDNMSKINDKAADLSVTFNQSLTKASDAFKISIAKVSDELGASGAFGAAIQFAIDHMDQLTAVLTVLAVATLPLIIKSVIGLVESLGLLNPTVLGVTALAAALISLNPAAVSALGPFQQLNYALYEFDISLETILTGIFKFTQYAPGAFGAVSKALLTLGEIDKKNSQEKIAGYDAQIAKIGELAKINTDGTADAQRRINDTKKAGDLLTGQLTAQAQLALLNRDVLKTGNVEAYAEALQKIQLTKANQEFKEGKIDIFQFHEALDKVSIERFTQQLKDGVITFQEFQDKTRQLKINELNEQFAAGKITLDAYAASIVKVEDSYTSLNAVIAGTTGYIDSVGTRSQGIAHAIQDTFASVETSIENFIKTGKFNFATFTQGILDDLTKIIVRAEIVAPLAKGILGLSLVGGGGTAFAGSDAAASASTEFVAAKGAAFDVGSVRKFAGGGVFDSPTSFSYGGGRPGVMGEAGPEAILPLTRGSGGALGVQAAPANVNVNIINQNGSEVKQQTTTGPNGEKTIEIIIAQKVKEGLSSGKYDTALKQSFGLSRKGV